MWCSMCEIELLHIPQISRFLSQEWQKHVRVLSFTCFLFKLSVSNCINCTRLVLHLGSVTIHSSTWIWSLNMFLSCLNTFWCCLHTILLMLNAICTCLHIVLVIWHVFCTRLHTKFSSCSTNPTCLRWICGFDTVYTRVLLLVFTNMLLVHTATPHLWFSSLNLHKCFISKLFNIEWRRWCVV